MTSAPGCDGWKSQEVKCWPESGWAKLLGFWRDWCEADSFPQDWQHARVAMIAKDEVVQGGVPVSAMRREKVESMR